MALVTLVLYIEIQTDSNLKRLLLSQCHEIHHAWNATDYILASTSCGEQRSAHQHLKGFSLPCISSSHADAGVFWRKCMNLTRKTAKKTPECLLLTGWHGKEKQTGGTGTLWLRLPFLEIIILSFSCVSQLRKGSTMASKLQQSRVSLSMVQGQSSSSLTRRKGHSPQSLGRWITKYHTLPLPSLCTLNLFMTLRHYLQDHPPAFLPGI